MSKARVAVDINVLLRKDFRDYESFIVQWVGLDEKGKKNKKKEQGQRTEEEKGREEKKRKEEDGKGERDRDFGLDDDLVLWRVSVLKQDDDHLVLELGLNFLTADDMIAILAVKLRKRLGFGMWAKLHIIGMHVEGKLLIGVKFLRRWPFLGRLRICFIEPPYFQMTVKPIFTHGLDVTVLPGIAGWLLIFYHV
ncbi:hypothetical protein RchiOBHm_Chr2g0159511 [Rosa chinensis]|uniref:Uncharacterized protein n=1 Tax=Rosa chinensis TaxID=74649 RepID=A0A2P6S296_ROSCH|nr:hypothetical protein RchiOBHm_Chr2g0159511 [Rosa chinensis]